MAASREGELGPIRVLLCGDVAAWVDEIRVLLEQSLLPLEVVGSCDSKACLAMARELKPDAILASDVEASVPALEISHQVYRSLAGTVTMVLARPEQVQDPAYVRRAMQNKASDVLPERPLLDALTRSLIEAVKLEGGHAEVRGSRRGRAPREGGGQLVALCSPKGGVGKSVLAANVGALIAVENPELRVALIDLDLQFGDQAVLLDLERTRSILDLLSVVGELTSDALQTAVIVHPSGLRVLLPPAEPEQADLVDEKSVREILLAFRRYHDLVLVDTSSRLSEVTLMALEQADQILLVCTPDVLSIWKARAFLGLCEGMGVSKDSVRLVINRTSGRSEIQPAELRELFADRPWVEIPADFFALQAYINSGRPMLRENSRGPIAKGLRALSKGILSGVPSSAEAPPTGLDARRGWLGLR